MGLEDTSHRLVLLRLHSLGNQVLLRFFLLSSHVSLHRSEQSSFQQVTNSNTSWVLQLRPYAFANSRSDSIRSVRRHLRSGRTDVAPLMSTNAQVLADQSGSRSYLSSYKLACLCFGGCHT